LDLDGFEARARMRYLRAVVGRRDVHAWARDFLATLSRTDDARTRGFESVA
jgi:ornithine cyclodeaminase/alanine dehydrogenase-like protein (mu-crystallin family)